MGRRIPTFHNKTLQRNYVHFLRHMSTKSSSPSKCDEINMTSWLALLQYYGYSEIFGGIRKKNLLHKLRQVKAKHKMEVSVVYEYIRIQKRILNPYRKLYFLIFTYQQ